MSLTCKIQPEQTDNANLGHLEPLPAPRIEPFGRCEQAKYAW